MHVFTRPYWGIIIIYDKIDFHEEKCLTYSAHHRLK